MILKIIVNIFVAIIELLCVNMLCLKFENNTKNRKYWLGILTSLLYIFFSIMVTLFNINQAIMMICNLFVLFCFTYYYNIKIVKRLLSILIYIFISLVYEVLILTILSIIIKVEVVDLLSNVTMYLTSAIISKSAMFLTFKLIILFIKPKSEITSFRYSICTIFLPLTSTSILFILSYFAYSVNSEIVSRLLILLSMLLLISNLGAYAIFEFGIKNQLRAQKNQAEKYELEKRQIELNDLLEQQYRSNKEIHDFKHKIYTLKEFVGKNNKKAQFLINAMCDIYKEKELISYTQLADVDALLNAKKSMAKIKNIDIIYTIIQNGKIKISSFDLCIILGNIIDNAIEHIDCNSENKTIILQLKTQKEFLCIFSENSTTNSNYIFGKTTKNNNSLMHGYGISNIKELAEKYDGFVNCEISNGVFKISITMDNSISHL